MNSDDSHKMPFWKIRLSTFFLLVAVVALAIGWFTESRRLRQELLETRQRLQLLETSQYFDGNRNEQRR